MAILKCKMCGGNLEVIEGTTVCECDSCGTTQTVPTVDNEKKITLFTRANRLRSTCEFDKAAGVYESIVAEFPEEAEAYWGLILCKYGIEYVDDPATAKKIPTCHRSSFDSVMDNNNFEMVMEYSDTLARSVYRDEAKAIEALRMGIIEVSGKEEPYDIFICYKETDENGDRTIDSVLAQDVYDILVEKGYRVFFSRITLEDKLGQEYEPYIFAALNSAKIMLAFGTDYEYYNAVWVKNEWSRYLQLMENDKSKYLIPCYKDIDAYDMPKEFAKLQAQDLGKVGATQDLMRGIEKILPRNKGGDTVVQQVVTQHIVNGPTVENYLKRGNIALEDSKWDEADKFFELALNENAEEARAYLGKLLIELKITSEEKLVDYAESFSNNEFFRKAVRFGDNEFKTKIENYNNQAIYNKADKMLYNAKSPLECDNAKDVFFTIKNYSDSKKQIQVCDEKKQRIINRVKIDADNILEKIAAGERNNSFRESLNKLALIYPDYPNIYLAHVLYDLTYKTTSDIENGLKYPESSKYFDTLLKYSSENDKKTYLGYKEKVKNNIDKYVGELFIITNKQLNEEDFSNAEKSARELLEFLPNNAKANLYLFFALVQRKNNKDYVDNNDVVFNNEVQNILKKFINESEFVYIKKINEINNKRNALNERRKKLINSNNVINSKENSSQYNHAIKKILHGKIIKFVTIIEAIITILLFVIPCSSSVDLSDENRIYVLIAFLVGCVFNVICLIIMNIYSENKKTSSIIILLLSIFIYPSALILACISFNSTFKKYKKYIKTVNSDNKEIKKVISSNIGEINELDKEINTKITYEYVKDIINSNK